MRWLERVAEGIVAHRHGRSLARLAERLRYAVVSPRESQVFWVVSCTRNAGTAAVTCLDSVYRQAYPKDRVTQLFIDDASTDGTDLAIENWLAAHPDHSVEYIKNTKRLGGLANTVRGFRMAPSESIVLEVNGDDWLPDTQVLSFYDKVYADSNVWMTYNTLRYPHSDAPAPKLPVPRSVIRANSAREYRSWVIQHLHTFRQELFLHMDEESFIDPATGDYWASADDQAIYLGLIELAGVHARHLWRTTYVYNRPSPDAASEDPTTSRERVSRIRRTKKYQPLSTLG